MVQTLKALHGPESAGTRDEAGFGCLETEKGNLPLVALEASWHVQDLVARGTVRQRYRNPLEEALEATYIFPLPDRGAVLGFVMRVKERTIEAELHERRKARRRYDQAIASGFRASIAEEDRPEVFTLRVGNIPPKEDVDIELTVICPLDATTDEATFRFPLVVAPRYVSGIPLDGPSVGGGVVPDTDEVPDASRVTPPVLLDGFPNPVRLGLEVTIDDSELYTPGWIDGLASSLHSVIVREGPPVRVRLQAGNRLDRDFILRIPLQREQIASSFLVARKPDCEDGVFSVTLVPPSSGTSQAPVDVVFVLDRSGSMSGWKIVTARRALERMIDALTEQDRFAVVAFDNVCEWGPHGHAQGGLQQASSAYRHQMIRWLTKIDARGGTELGDALQQAVATFAGERCRSPILVVITDGQVAGEDAVLRRLDMGAARIRPRVLAVGIDEAANFGLLRRLARWGNGVCEQVESNDRLKEVLLTFQRCIRPPVVRNVMLEPKGWELCEDSLEPASAVDLYPGRPATITGRFRTDSPLERLAVRATATLADGTSWSCEVPARVAQADVLLAVWGREKLRALEDAYVLAPNRRHRKWLERRIVATSLETKVLCRFTALVAVDKSEVVNDGGNLISVTQPVELPRGWDAQYLQYSPAAPKARALAFCEPFPSCAFLLHHHEPPSKKVSVEERKEISATDLRRAIDRAEELMDLVEQLLGCIERDVLRADGLSSVVAILVEELENLAQNLPGGPLQDRCRTLAERGSTLVRRLGEGKGVDELTKWLPEVAELLRALSQRERDRFWTC